MLLNFHKMAKGDNDFSIVGCREFSCPAHANYTFISDVKI